MRLETYPEAKKMPEKYLSSFVDAEIECWGSEPFSEFRICKNNGCKAVFSIEDVYGSIDEFQKRREIGKLDNNFCCEECGDETEYVYEKEELLSLIKRKIEEKVIAVLLITPGECVSGFGILSNTTLGKLIYDEIDNRKDSYNKEEAIKLLSNLVYGNNDSRKNNVVYSNQIYVSPKFRGGNIPFEIVKTTFNLNSSELNDLPIVGETKYNSKFYPISRLIGYIDCMVDKYGNVLQYCSKYKNVLNFLNTQKSFTSKSSVNTLLHFKKEAREILKSNQLFTKRKYYK